MANRKYNDAEVAAIFERATKAQQAEPRQLTEGEGLSLAELQDIGREVGLAPDLIVQAALSIDSGGRQTTRKMFGMPVGVGRTVDLGRKLTDDEWDHLVVDLRDTFDARGAIRGDGMFRQWTNGNLQVLLEPTPTGHRLRLRTFKSDAPVFAIAGVSVMVAAVVTLTVSIATGHGVASSVMTQFMLPALASLGILSFGAVRVSNWARLRQQQMQDVVARLAAKLT